MATSFIIQHKVKQAVSINQFRYAAGAVKGQRIQRMPYWILLPDAWVFEYISNDTDVQLLQSYVEKGIIYLLDKIDDCK
jgi:hypothetical protein